MANDPDDEERRLHFVALQNAQSTVRARRRAEEELRKQSEWFRVTLASIGDGVISTDAEERVTFMNAVAESLTGWTQAEALGFPLGEVFRIIDEETRAPLGSPAMRALAEGAIVGLANHTLLIARDGTLCPIDDSAAPIRGPAGEMIGCILVFRDVTARRRAEQERDALMRSERAARAEAERTSRLKEEFLATLSHELRTPLSAILGWIQILIKKPTPENLAQGLVVLERNARMQAQLIADLLDMSRILSGKMRLDVQKVEVAVVVEAALDAVRPAVEAKELQLASVIEPIPWPIHADPSRLQQVVWNLLSNAVKFTPQGGRVQVQVTHTPSHLALTVSDTGRGISPEFLPHVFERFRQADSSAAREQGGLGLGLAIVKQLVELHGGSITAESDGADQGTTFRVLLPIAAVPPPAHTAMNAHAMPAVPTPQEYATPDLRGVRVLVLDDDSDARDLIRRVLEECGASVVLASSAEEGLAVFDAGADVDVIVSDIGLPGRDGYFFIAEVRRRGVRAPAAALTAFARSEDRTRALIAGYQTHVAKPVEPSELIATVAALAHKTSLGRVDRGAGG